MTVLDTQEATQLEYYEERVDPEFEIQRPRGAGRFYKFLMEYKISAVVKLLHNDLSGRSVLVVCAGSGMDAELLLRFGPRVTCLDVSSAALTRAAERARRYRLTYRLVASDAEHLPFADNAFDYAFVHDGLHHLTDPEGAISEMARVSRYGIIITEPADAWLSAVAIRLGIMSAFEDAGNRVFRFHQTRMREVFHTLGLPVVRHRRYMVKYYHRPGALFRMLDLPGLFHLARLAFLLLGVTLFGRLGNKLAMVALTGDKPSST